jgi:hypothetical protein
VTPAAMATPTPVAKSAVAATSTVAPTPTKSAPPPASAAAAEATLPAPAKPSPASPAQTISPSPVQAPPAPPAAPAPAARPQATGPTVIPDIDHLKRAWPLVLEAAKKRAPGLPALLGEGRPDSLDGNELVIKFPAGHSFAANQVARGDNPLIIAEALLEVTGTELRVTTKLAPGLAPENAGSDEDARILSKDELIRVLKREFDARDIDDGPTR